MTMPPPTPVPSVSMIRLDAPRPAPRRHSASAAALPSFSTPAGTPWRSRARFGKWTSWSGRLTARSATPRAAVDVERHAEADRGRAVRHEVRDDAVDRAQHLFLAAVGRRDLDRAADRAVPRDEAGADLRPAQVDSDNAFFTHVAATITARMPEQEKPYKAVQGRSGEGQGPVAAARGQPLERHRHRGERQRSRASGTWAGGSRSRSPSCSCSGSSGSLRATSRCRRASRTRTRASRSPSSPSSRARTGCSPRPRRRSSWSAPTAARSRAGATPAGPDSIMLVRTDPRKHRLAFLSIPRDLRVEIPGYGSAQDQRGLAARRPGPGAEDGEEPHRARRQPRRLRRLRPVPRADRLGRRRRHRRSPADPREQVRLPLRDRRALPKPGRAGASRRGPSTWTAVGR